MKNYVKLLLLLLLLFGGLFCIMIAMGCDWCSLLLCCGIPLLVSFVLGVFFIKSKSKSNTNTNTNFGTKLSSIFNISDIISIIGIFIAIFSIFATAFWDVLVQYKDWRDPIKNMYKDSYTKNWSDFTSKADTMSKKIIFIINDSDTLRQIKVSDSSSEKIKDKVIHSGWFTETSDVFKPNIENMEGLAQTRLMWLLYQIKNIKGEYAIWKFSSKVSVGNLKKITEENLKNDFQENNKDSFYNGIQANFLELLKYINKYFYNSNKDPSKKQEWLLVFVNDIIPDTNNQYDKDLISIREELMRIKSHSLFSNLYSIKLDDEKAYKSLSDEFKICFNATDYEIIELSNTTTDNFIIFSSISTKEVFPFYYTSSLYGDNISTILNFDNIVGDDNNFDISLRNIGNNNIRQNFILKKDVDKAASFLIKDNIKESFSIAPKQNLIFSMSGRIPAQYPFVEFVVKDNKTHLIYNIEVVFFKALPQLRWVIPLWSGLLVCYITLLLITKFL